MLAVGDEGWNQSAGTDAKIQDGELAFAGDAKQGLKKTFPSQPSACTDLSALVYQFRVDNRSAGSKIAPALKIEVTGANRTDNPSSGSTFTTLINEPTYQSTRDTVESTREGQVNAMAPGNKWWSSNPVGGAPTRETYVPFETLCAQNPDMKVGSVLFEAGSGSGSAFAAAGDNLLIGFDDEFTRYDFGG